MYKVWRNFLIAITSVLVLLLAFCVIYEELSKGDDKERNTTEEYIIDNITVYSKNGDIIYQCCTDEDITFSVSDEELSVYTPYTPCSCFVDEYR